MNPNYMISPSINDPRDTPARERDADKHAELEEELWWLAGRVAPLTSLSVGLVVDVLWARERVLRDVEARLS